MLRKYSTESLYDGKKHSQGENFQVFEVFLLFEWNETDGS